MGKYYSRYDEICIVLLALLCLYLLMYVRLAMNLENQPPIGNHLLRTVLNHDDNSRHPLLVEPIGPLFNKLFRRNKVPREKQGHDPRRALVIAASPRTTKHIVSLWSSLECFASDVDHVAISAPTWSQDILERFILEASSKIPRFASGQASLEGMVTINDRYDVGLWCDALEMMGIESSVSSWGEQADSNNRRLSASSNAATSPYDQIGLLNDSVYALREFTGVLRALSEQEASMSSLNYCLSDLEGEGPDHYWLESVWRGFDQEGLRTFVDYSCRPMTDPLFCSQSWWGQKGCIVENFERNMARQFSREKTVGLFASDVPKEMLTWKHSFPTWVRHPPYWKKLVEEQDFPVSKVNWNGMIESIDDERLNKCTQHLDRTWLQGFDFSAAKATI